MTAKKPVKKEEGEHIARDATCRGISAKCRAILVNLLVFLAGAVFIIIMIELFISLTDYDIKMMLPYLYYTDSDSEVHRLSDDAQKIYELKPNSSYPYSMVHPNETKYSVREVTVNSLGFRDKERTREKPKGIFRIFMIGSSGVYGTLVSDEDTFPAQMQKKLDAFYPGRFEVWNAGVSAYVWSNRLAYAEEIMKNYGPDLLIFHNINRGRRAFLRSDNYTYRDYARILKKNRELLVENLPPMGFFNMHVPPEGTPMQPFSGKNILPYPLHNYLVKYSGLYRLLLLAHYKILAKEEYFNQELFNESLVIGHMISLQSLERFYEKYRNMDKIILDIEFPDYLGCGSKPYLLSKRSFRGNFPPNPDKDSFLMICPFNKSGEYSDGHPPSYVYDWYADVMISALQEAGYVPAKDASVAP